ncbi:uncharacterized protein LOC111074533 [Drosophila obscura]|uniref:uncharacterized protein LOC111074533 n=1 Tax=Drosophila obscura TaxID=7282 RepID=UPI001BB16902|nr:uncharacterized protein LOC111074533 [Drosophila obscura]
MSHDNSLGEFFTKLNLAKWYTGISDYQLKAIAGITAGLLDDFEQGTSFRMEERLKMLGVHPLVGRRKIHTMVQLSRGNDLAFLFFMLEGYYKTCNKDGNYTTNEKLLMIAIAKIDLLPTLNELDRILPPPQLSRWDVPHQQRLNPDEVPSAQSKQPKVSAPAKPTRSKASKKSPRDPYKQRLRRPVVKPTSFLCKGERRLVVSFPFWAKECPPNYGKSRDPPWFSLYKLDPVKRIVKRTLDETVDKYFGLKELAAKADTNGESKLAYEMAKQQPMFNEEPNLCTHHQEMIAQAQHLKDELTVKARDRCLEMLDPSQPHSRVRRKRIIDQLEYEIEASLERLRQAMHTDQVKVMKLRDHSCVVCQEALVKITWPDPGQKVGRALVGEGCNLAHTATTTEGFTGRRLSGGGLNSEPQEVPQVSARLVGGGLHMDKIDFNIEPEQKSAIEANECEGHPETPKSRITFLLDENKVKPIDLARAKPVNCDGCEYNSSVKYTRKSFFRAPDTHMPYNFRYHRVLQSGQPKPYDLAKIVTKSIVKALEKSQNDEIVGETCPLLEPYKKQPPELEQELELDPKTQKTKRVSKDSSYHSSDTEESLDSSSDHSSRSQVDHKADIVNAVVRCAKAIWTKRAAIKRAEMDRNERVPSDHSLRPEVLHYDMEHFDPDDNELMDRMLADGMKELRKHHRFVLATLPDAHKIPILRQWIKRRYGKAYTQRELQENLKESLQVFETVTHLQNHPPKPDRMGLAHTPESKQNYAYYKPAMAEAGRVKAAYYTRLNNVYLNQMTACWYAMGNYLCPGGPPRTTFYAYMASNHQDVLRAKLWNGEYRDHRQFSEKKKNN